MALIQQEALKQKLPQVWIFAPSDDHSFVVHTVHRSSAYEDLKPWLMAQLQIMTKAAQGGVTIDWNYIFRYKAEMSAREQELRLKDYQALIPDSEGS